MSLCVGGFALGGGEEDADVANGQRNTDAKDLSLGTRGRRRSREATGSGVRRSYKDEGCGGLEATESK